MRHFSRIIIAIIFFSPIFASAQTTTPATPPADPLNLQRQGIFDCNQNGAYSMSVGALGATGGVYVPVADSTVELNTGVIVYKECVLREVINRMREAAMAGFNKKAVTAIATGRGGNKQYVVNQGRELLQKRNRTFLTVLEDGTLSGLNSSFQQHVTRALVLGYQKDTRAPESILTCPYQGDLEAALTHPTQSFSWEALDALANPACNPLGAYYLAQNLADNRIAACEQYLQNQWDWGRGYYDLNSNPENPCLGDTETPAVNIQEGFQTILDSPVRQLESANDIGQMINAFYAGQTVAMMSENQGGLAGFTQSVGGQPRYIDRVVQEASQGLREAVTNVAIQNLQAARQVEALYFQTVSAIGAALTTAIGQLRSAERQCWDLVVYQNDGHPERHVCAGPLTTDNTCTSFTSGCTTDAEGIQTCPVGVPLKIATSTAFSQSIIEREITPLATITATRITASQNALNLVARLIDSVTGASLDAQRLAIIQLNSLIARRLLHVPPDIDGPSGVSQQLESVRNAMLGDPGLVVDTIKLWANSPTVRPGWCNVNNPAVVDAWKRCWNKNNPDRSACPTP